MLEKFSASPWTVLDQASAARCLRRCDAVSGAEATVDQWSITIEVDPVPDTPVGSGQLGLGVAPADRVAKREIACCRSGSYGSDYTPHRGQRAPIIERDLAEGLYSQVIPESCQIVLNGLRFHLLVELCQHRNPCCFVAEHQRAFKRPTDFDITAAGEDRPQRVLQAAVMVRALMYLVSARVQKSAPPQ